MGGMTTFGNNDSVFSHGEDSISMLNRLAEIAKEAFKYIPEKDCTVACGTFVDIDARAFLSAVQHFRESIEAYRDLCDELEDDKDETNYRAGELARLIHQLGNQVGELDNRCFSLNKELEEERERSTQLEQRIKVLTAERDLAKKLAKRKSEELKRQLNEKYGTVVACMELKDKLDKKCREVGELTSTVANLQNELDHVYEKIELIKADRDRYFKQLCESGYFDTDILHMYPKTMLNNPANFCGNCKHCEIRHGVEDYAICNNIWCTRFVIDPDDASCEHFKPTYDTRVVIGKPEFPVCEKCSREDCSNCTLCPF